eukprot:3864022-Rhodomonas_salina.3
MPLCYVMAVFHRLRALHGLEGIASDRLWLLAQSGKLHEVVGMTERVQGGAGVVVKGEAELKAYAAAEKPGLWPSFEPAKLTVLFVATIRTFDDGNADACAGMHADVWADNAVVLRR